MKKLLFSLLFACSLPPALYPQDIPAENGQKDRDTLKYGTDTEIKALIQRLKKEKLDFLDADLVELAKKTKNPALKSEIFIFFTTQNEEADAKTIKNPLENEAITFIEERGTTQGEYILAAVNYLGSVHAENAQETLRSLLESGESYNNLAVIRAIGWAGGEATKDERAEYLVEYLKNKSPADEEQKRVIETLGDIGSLSAVPLLIEVADENKNTLLTLSALTALAKLKAPSALPQVIEALASSDHNIRSAAVAALGSFEGAEADEAIIESFRDSYYKTRVAAIKAAGDKKLTAAVPYLKYRAENDEVPVVKEAALRSLSAIGGGDAEEALASFLENKKAGDNLRLLAARELIKLNADKYAQPVIARYEEARGLNQKTLVSGFINALSKAKTPGVKSFTEKLFSSKNVYEQSLALELTRINKFSEFRGQVERIANEKNSSLAGRARIVLGEI